MIKFRLYYDKDKEENFLNNMVKKGYAMKSFFLGFYTFEKCEPNEYTYRVDLIKDKSQKELEEYIELITETGAEYVQRWGVWVIFRKKGEFELYTDVESKIEQYSKIKTMFLLLGIAELCMSPMQVINYINYKVGISLFTAILVISVGLIFLIQVIKCNIKINELKINNKFKS